MICIIFFFNLKHQISQSFKEKNIEHFISNLTLEIVLRKIGTPSSWITCHNLNQDKNCKNKGKINMIFFVVENIKLYIFGIEILAS